MTRRTIIPFAVAVAVAVAFIASSLPAQSAGPLWTKTYGEDGIAHAYSIHPTSDGGFVMAGKFRDGEGDAWDVYLIRTDSAGDTLWIRTFGGDGDDIARSVIETADGGFVITGKTQSPGDGSWDIYLLKTDADGREIWVNTYGETQMDFAKSVIQTSDGGYALAGATMGGNGETYDAYLVKTDADGNQQWARSYGGEDGDFATAVAEIDGGGYIIGAATESFGRGMVDFYLIRTDAGGGILWARTYGGEDWDVPWDVRQTADGGFIAAGETRSFSEHGMDVYLVRTDGAGETEWARNYGGEGRQTAQAVWPTPEGDFVVGGYTYIYEEWGQDIYVARVRADGEVAWVKTFGGPGRDIAHSIMQAMDGACVVAGETESFGHKTCEAYLLKIDQ
ncbi:MAG: hypothetical protein PVF95_06345 [bacterium]|jgi:hypothetical protein